MSLQRLVSFLEVYSKSDDLMRYHFHHLLKLCKGIKVRLDHLNYQSESIVGRL
jgi:hypothetical protein